MSCLYLEAPHEPYGSVENSSSNRGSHIVAIVKTIEGEVADVSYKEKQPQREIHHVPDKETQQLSTIDNTHTHTYVPANCRRPGYPEKRMLV